MNSDIRKLLEEVQSGSVSVDDALLKIKMSPFEDIGYAKVDLHRRVRQGAADTLPVKGMDFSYDREKLASAIDSAYQLPGIYYIRVWLNEGQLDLGDDIMLVLIGGDIRPHVVDALQYLVGRLKEECVTETELH